MVEVYAILGDANARKSSTVRALTGAAQRALRTVATNAGNIDIFVQISSLQESTISPADFIQEITNLGCRYVLVTLWIQSRQIFPSGQDYLQKFTAAGWTIQQLVVLGAPQLPPLPSGTPTPNLLPQSEETPANQIASRIRTWWGWF
jgi:hypothetical protein